MKGKESLWLTRELGYGLSCFVDGVVFEGEMPTPPQADD